MPLIIKLTTKTPDPALEQAAEEYAQYLTNIQAVPVRGPSTDEFSTADEIERAGKEYAKRGVDRQTISVSAEIPIQNPEVFTSIIKLLKESGYPIDQLFKPNQKINQKDRWRIIGVKSELFEFISQMIPLKTLQSGTWLSKSTEFQFQTIEKTEESKQKHIIKEWVTIQKHSFLRRIKDIYPGIDALPEEATIEASTPPATPARAKPATPQAPGTPTSIPASPAAGSIDGNFLDDSSFRTPNRSRTDSNPLQAASIITSTPKTSTHSMNTSRLSTTSLPVFTTDRSSSRLFPNPTPPYASAPATPTKALAKKTLSDVLNPPLIESIKARKNTIIKSHHNLFDELITALSQSGEKRVSLLFKLLADSAEATLQQDKADDQAKKSVGRGHRLSTVHEQIRTTVIQAVNLTNEVLQQESLSIKTLLKSLQIYAWLFLSANTNYQEISSTLKKFTELMIYTSDDLKILVRAINALKTNATLPLWLHNNYEDLLPRLQTLLNCQLRTQSEQVSKRLDFSSLATPAASSHSSPAPIAESPVSRGSVADISAFSAQDVSEDLHTQFIYYIDSETRKYSGPGADLLKSLLKEKIINWTYQQILAMLSELSAQQITAIRFTSLFGNPRDPFALPAFCEKVRAHAYFLFSLSASEIYQIESYDLTQKIAAVNKAFCEKSDKTLQKILAKTSPTLPEESSPCAHYQSMAKVIGALKVLQKNYPDLYLPTGTLQKMIEQWQELSEKLLTHPDNMWFSFTIALDKLQKHLENEDAALEIPASMRRQYQNLNLEGFRDNRFKKILSFLHDFVLDHAQNKKTFKIESIKQENETEALCKRSIISIISSQTMTIIYSVDGQDYQLTVKNFGTPEEESFELITIKPKTPQLSDRASPTSQA